MKCKKNPTTSVFFPNGCFKHIKRDEERENENELEYS